ncbi:uncharacterized protein KNAG_0D03050 [Huiozyma naganishii CBS 8797]|uniref:STB6-like N-terminal domain-containing protein n=1 Tax=Huiozyma naganishii (strain ATCC MYA-139 / BCRC 22969 / CBS 8797 / KCTC 17520 / NBRC 10181 / NCYC 3082 / Yp74L-3) TaxID=1071383 RepID=J7RKM8_HUIN7|nr:hypothetical protein KNAG_0D03050 [Kazachstania naganishii CBS 8797]CCK70053.1 hypothetical protein KNAG_0D03050 [Kazachstania naganishii CBS 8797]
MSETVEAGGGGVATFAGWSGVQGVCSVGRGGGFGAVVRLWQLSDSASKLVWRVRSRDVAGWAAPVVHGPQNITLYGLRCIQPQFSGLEKGFLLNSRRVPVLGLHTPPPASVTMVDALANAYSHMYASPRDLAKTPSNRNRRASNEDCGVVPPIELASFIFPDKKALLEIDIASYSDVSYKEVLIIGFEIYIVEQWVAERKLSSIITSYTGNTQDAVSAVEVVLPAKFEYWPGKFQQYYNELLAFAQPKLPREALGTVFITDLSTVPLSLNIIHIECGDLRTIWHDFKINFNLKMMHCAGRSSALLAPPSSAAKEKFAQLYKIPLDFKDGKRTHVGNTFFGGTTSPTLLNLQRQKPATNVADEYSPVNELVEIVQICLLYFNRFHYRVDGLLCHSTKAQIDDWWDHYGKLYLGCEKPRNEATLGPTTVASLVSLVLCCFYKLALENCINTKDPFDAVEYFNGVYNFQKKLGIIRPNKKIYLDHLTLEKLFESTQKFSSNDFLKLRKAVKSKMQDLAGKQNTTHLSDEILTSDLDTLINHVSGGSLGYLWKGENNPKLLYQLEHRHNNFCRFSFNRGDPKMALEQRKDEIKNFQRKPRFYTPDSSKKQNTAQFVESNFNSQNMATENGRSFSNSILSISSMFPNYDKPTASLNVECNKIYQGEFHRRNSLPFCHDGTRDSEELTAWERDHEQSMYRSNSVSNIMDVLFKWELPFDPSMVKVARDLKKLDTNLNRQKKLQDTEVDDLEENEGSVAPDTAKYKALTKKLQEDHEQYAKHSVAFDGRAQSLRNKQQILSNEMKEINSLSSKLTYDIRILELRVRDVEESVQQFNLKLKNMKKSLILRDEDVSEALKHTSNDQEFDAYVRRAILSERTCYKGLCLSMLHRDSMNEVRNDLMSWIGYFFSSFSTSSNDTQKSMSKPMIELDGS